MSKAQKGVLVIGLLLMALAALFPPRGYFGREDVFRPRGFLFRRELTQKPTSIDLEKLVVEWIFGASMTGALVVISGKRSKGVDEEDKETKS